MKKKSNTTVFIILVFLAILWIIPLVWVLSTSLKTEVAAAAWPIRWIPKDPTLNNFNAVLNDSQANVKVWFLNSIINASIYTIIVLIVDSLAAYAFGRFQFRGRDVLFFIMLATMMIPNVLNLVPLYAIVNKFGWINTRWALIIPGVASVFGVFLLRQFFMGIPRELEEAASIDGASHFQIFYKIMLPLVKPGLVVLGLFSFLANWNDYMWPLTVINSNEQRTLTIGLSVLKGTYNVLYAKMMAVTVLSIVPIIILFIFAQKYFMQGSNISSGIKG